MLKKFERKKRAVIFFEIWKGISTASISERILFSEVPVYENTTLIHLCIHHVEIPLRV